MRSTSMSLYFATLHRLLITIPNLPTSFNRPHVEGQSRYATVADLFSAGVEDFHIATVLAGKKNQFVRRVASRPNVSNPHTSIRIPLVIHFVFQKIQHCLQIRASGILCHNRGGLCRPPFAGIYTVILLAERPIRLFGRLVGEPLFAFLSSLGWCSRDC